MSDYEFNAVIGNKGIYHKGSEENENPLMFRKKCVKECKDIDFDINDDIEYYFVNNLTHEESKVHMKNRKAEQEFCEKLIEKLKDCEQDIEELQTSESTKNDDFMILGSAWNSLDTAIIILDRIVFGD